MKLAAKLKSLGCDYVTASSGGAVPEQKIELKPHYQVPFANQIRHKAGIATMAVGLITEPRQAEEILQTGQADLIALGRGMLFNPRWPWHAAMELGGEATYPPQYERSHPSMRQGNFLKAGAAGRLKDDSLSVFASQVASCAQRLLYLAHIFEHFVRRLERIEPCGDAAIDGRVQQHFLDVFEVKDRY